MAFPPELWYQEDIIHTAADFEFAAIFEPVIPLEISSQVTGLRLSQLPERGKKLVGVSLRGLTLLFRVSLRNQRS